MLKFLQKNRCWPIGLDIGTDSIRMLQLQDSQGELSVRASGQWQFSPTAQRDPAQRKQETVSAIRDILRKADFRGRRVVTSLSSNQLSIKNIRVPQMSPAELDRAVWSEAKERFSFEFTRDQLKYFTAGQIRSGNEMFNEIIVLAVPPQVVDDHLAMLDSIGLFPEHIEAEPVALFRCAERFLRRSADEDAVTVLVDIGVTGTRVIVGRGRQIVFIKNIDIAGQDLTDAVARQLNLDIAEARDLRQRVRQEHSSRLGGKRASDRKKASEEFRSDVDWTIRDAVRAKIEDLGKELALCLRYCSVTFRGLRPQVVSLTGGETYDPAVIEILKEQLGIDCVVAKVLQGVDLGSSQLAQGRLTSRSEWALAIGMALRDSSLFEVRKEKRHERRLSA